MPDEATNEVMMPVGCPECGNVGYRGRRGIYGTLPFLVLFQIGFLYTGLVSIVQQYSGDDPVVLKTQVASGK